VVNINTNASRPSAIGRIFDAGCDSMRVSMNSARGEYYARYYRPRGYAFRDVVRSIKTAKERGGFVSVNYLTMPGFTDSAAEFAAFADLIEAHGIDMIQWRNLNYDPVRYFKDLRLSGDSSGLLGIREVIAAIKKDFPSVMTGYFNPSRARMKRNARGTCQTI
jgi:MoaA/NifB/PqqE/SkfB family radical SAM enzyme